jgi:hypothetical protein
LFTTHSTSSAISHPDARSASSETKRSGHGELLPRHESKIGRPKFHVASNVRVTTPSRVFEARANLIWSVTTPEARRGISRWASAWKPG